MKKLPDELIGVIEQLSMKTTGGVACRSCGEGFDNPLNILMACKHSSDCDLAGVIKLVVASTQLVEALIKVRMLVNGAEVRCSGLDFINIEKAVDLASEIKAAKGRNRGDGTDDDQR